MSQQEEEEHVVDNSFRVVSQGLTQEVTQEVTQEGSQERIGEGLTEGGSTAGSEPSTSQPLNPELVTMGALSSAPIDNLLDKLVEEFLDPSVKTLCRVVLAEAGIRTVPLLNKLFFGKTELFFHEFFEAECTRLAIHRDVLDDVILNLHKITYLTLVAPSLCSILSRIPKKK